MSAEKSTILLKNIRGTLPLHSPGQAQPGARQKVLAVVGPNANRTLTLGSNYCGCKNRAGGPLLRSCTFVNPLEGLRAAARNASGWDSEVKYELGVDIDTGRTDGIAAAVAVAKQADVVVVVAGLITCQETGEQCQEAEARDRSTPLGNLGELGGKDVGIHLPGMQLELLQSIANSTEAAHTQIVLVIMSGSAVAVPWAASSDRVGAIVQSFYSGVLGGAALADVLFGRVAPAGRLPVMVPTSEAQLPADYLNQSMLAGSGRTHAYFQGSPLYQFGFGLGTSTNCTAVPAPVSSPSSHQSCSSVCLTCHCRLPGASGYSSFAYSNLRLSHHTLAAGEIADVATEMTVSVTVTNRGEFAGPSDEVVMWCASAQLTDRQQRPAAYMFFHQHLADSH